MELKYVYGKNVFDLYGKWNGIAATTADNSLLGWVRSHDGDFFPSSILDYVETIRNCRLLISLAILNLLLQLV